MIRQIAALRRAPPWRATSARCWSDNPAVDSYGHVQDEHGHIIGSQTPVTKRLWQQRYRRDAEQLAAAAPAAAGPPRPPRTTEVRYAFSADAALREHYRNPWGGVRLGRVLEDMDSLAGFAAYSHCDDGNAGTRPPLLVTASVDALEVPRGPGGPGSPGGAGGGDERDGSAAGLSLARDMALAARVVWSSATSLDVAVELRQGGGGDGGAGAGDGGAPAMTAFFTFAARDAVTGAPAPVAPLRPETPPDRDAFCARQRIQAARKAARAAGGGDAAAARADPAAAAWAAAALAEARARRDLPALADASAVLASQTELSNTFTCQPQQRNIHGRVFGGFLMRRALELAHSTAYLFCARRPRLEAVQRIVFRAPVSVGDLARFRAAVLHAAPDAARPGRGTVLVRVETAVTRPEERASRVTNTFILRFGILLATGADGRPVPPRRVLPDDEALAYEMAALVGPSGHWPPGEPGGG